MANLTLKMTNERDGLEFSIPSDERALLRPRVLSRLITHLTGLRSKMTPPVISDRPREGDPIVHHPKSMWAVEPLPEPHKGVALMVGHPGAGWSAVHLNAENAKRLSNALQLFLLEEETATRQ